MHALCSAPGLYIAGMSMRRGCVMLTLDLATSCVGLGSVPPVSALVRALAQAMRDTRINKLLGNGSALTAQVGKMRCIRVRYVRSQPGS